MPFCPNCKSLVYPQGGILKCAKCGTVAGKPQSRKVTAPQEEREVLVFSDEDVERQETMPRMKAECPSCGHMEAFYRTQQTRKSDEPETTFLRCAKCNHRWRKY